jgi:nucleoside-diphosphate-sugar epimerase
VLKACYEAKVKRVVMVSSIAAVFNNPTWPKGKTFDEESWSDVDLCRKSEVSKAMPSHLLNLW